MTTTELIEELNDHMPFLNQEGLKPLLRKVVIPRLRKGERLAEALKEVDRHGMRPTNHTLDLVAHALEDYSQ